MKKKDLFEKLKGLSLEEGATLIRENVKIIDEICQEDGAYCDFDFFFDNGYFHYRTSYTEVYDDAPIIGENGYWGMMLDGEHYTHIRG